MLNILRAQLFRLVRRPWFWVTLGLFVVYELTTAILAHHLDPYEFLSVDRTPDPTLLKIGLDSSESPILPDGRVPALFFIGASIGRWPATVAALIVMLLVSGDFGAGAIKNLPLVRGGRISYALATMALCAGVALTCTFIALGFALIGCTLTSATIAWPSADDIVLWELALWLGSTCYTAACASLTMLSGSRALGVAAVVLVPSGIIEVMLTLGAAVLPMTSEASIDVLFSFLPFDAMSTLRLGSVPWPHGVLACAGTLALGVVLGVLAMRRKDLGR